MKVGYSPRFKRQYDQLPLTSQMQFQLVDAQVKAGRLDVLRPNAWVYSIGVGGGFIAWGTPMGDDQFYWRDVDVAAKIPVIL